MKNQTSTTWQTLRPSRRLTLQATLLTLIGFLLFLAADYKPWQPIQAAQLLPFVLYLIVSASTLLLLHLTRFRGDALLATAALLLSAFGILAQTRIGSLNLETGLTPSNLAFPIGAALMLLTALLFQKKRYKTLTHLGPLFGWLVIIGYIALIILGNRYRGGIYSPGNFTPTELLKIPIVLFLATYMQQRIKALQKSSHLGLALPLRALTPLGLYWLLLAAFLVIQRDLGMFVILSAVMITMLFLATNRLSYLLYAILASGGFGLLAFRYLLHGQKRIQTWIDPFSDPTGAGWQILQSLSGLFAGGLWGAGFGQGQPQRIPIAASDFIYAALGEELGFLGCSLLVLLYLGLFRRAYKTAAQTKDPFGQLLIAGLTSILSAQTFLNLAGVTKLLPLTGLPLPFISHGGTSIITSFIAIGLIMAISASPSKTKKAHRRKKSKKNKP